MRTQTWTDVWNLFLDVIARESVPVQIFAGLAVAFIAVMALEGLRASFFPKQIADGAALRRPEPLPQREQPSAFTETPTVIEPALEYVAPPMLTAVNSGGDTSRRRSSPRALRVARKPSAKKFIQA